MDNILNELNEFSNGLDEEQKEREALEAKIWNMILNGGKEK